jgi:hypothetical protein
MTVYDSAADVGTRLNLQYLEQGVEALRALLV